MKIMLNILPIVLAISFLVCRAHADSPVGDVKIPASSWETHVEGIALATILISREEGGEKKYLLSVYLKNTSDSVKEYVVSGNDGGLQFFTRNEANAWTPLRDYGPNHYLASATHDNIVPGGIIHHEIELSPAEVALIEAHDLKAGFIIYDLTTMKKSIIESLPRRLTETVVAAPAAK
jgi:hypothetical protein